MAKTTKKEEPKTLTRAEKREAAKAIIRELLQKSAHKASELIEDAASLFTQRFAGEDTENANDVKGRIGSILDIMKKENEVRFEGGVYTLPAETTVEAKEEKPKKKPTAKKADKKAETEVVAEVKEEVKADKPKRTRAKKETVSEAVAEEKTETKETEAVEKPKAKRTAKKKTAEPLPVAPLQPIAPVAPITPETAPEPIPEKEEKQEKAEKPKRIRAKKAAVSETVSETHEEKPEIKAEEKTETKAEIKPETKAEAKAEAPKHALVDMSFLFGDIKPSVKKETATEKPNAEKEVKEVKAEILAPASTPTPAPAPAVTEKQTKKTEEKAQNKPQDKKPEQSKETQRRNEPKTSARSGSGKNSGNGKNGKTARVLTPDERLQEAFLARLHKLGGEYFEYYSVYLLERYSRRNGRRLEALKVTAGDHDGGIDGEIELTDRLGFRETIYIQAKNWDPDKGDEKQWTVGETLLQQFIGACVCRQAKEGKQHCRGIFITTSRFTPEAKKMLDDTSDKFVGYDGTELYETAKECAFGIIKKNGEYALDETLLSSTKAFFNMF